MAAEIDVLVVGGLLVIDHIAVLDRLPSPGGVTLFPGLTAALEDKFFGGNNVNLAAAAAALGLRVSLVCFAGEDVESSGYRAHLDEIGIRDRWLHNLDGQGIPHCYSFFDEQGTSLTFMDWLEPAHRQELKVPPGVIQSARQIVISGGEKDDLACGAVLDIAASARDAGVPVALAWAAGEHNFEPKYFELADTLLCNQFEIEVILRCFDLKGDESIHELGPKTIFVTRGKCGSDVYHDGKKVTVPVVQPTQVVDPTGAGDAYAGSALAARSWGQAPDICGRVGAVGSSYVVEKKGCQTNLPSRAMLERRYLAAFGEALDDNSDNE